MLVGTIDFYHFIPLSLTLTLAGVDKVSVKQNLTTSSFYLVRIKFDVVMPKFKLNILRLPLSKINRNKGNNCIFTEKNLTLAYIRTFTYQLIQTLVR